MIIWNTFLNEAVTEELYGITAARIETSTFVTDKAEIKRLPTEKPHIPKNK